MQTERELINKVNNPNATFGYRIKMIMLITDRTALQAFASSPNMPSRLQVAAQRRLDELQSQDSNRKS